jgi:hypothetical protein
MNAPTFPRNDTLTARALMRLVTGQQVTHRDFQSATASYRLSSNIEILRNDLGWPIDDVWHEAPTNDKVKRRAKFKRYFIQSDNLAAIRAELGERLDLFIEAVKRFESGHPQAANLGGGNA